MKRATRRTVEDGSVLSGDFNEVFSSFTSALHVLSLLLGFDKNSGSIWHMSHFYNTYVTNLGHCTFLPLNTSTCVSHVVHAVDMLRRYAYVE